MTSPDPLIAYLATHDAPCPGCYRNIRGHTEPECQACGQVLRLGEVLTMHAAFGNAKGDPVAVPATQLRETLLEFLSESDVNCPGCGYCLRGNTSGECPECGRRLQLHEITYKRPRPSPVLVNTLSFFMALPFALVAILIAWLAIDYNLSASWPIAGALILLCVLIISLFAFPVRRLLMERLMWIVVLNPITLVILLYLLCVGLVLIFG